MTQNTDTVAPELMADEIGHDPIEDRLRQNIRAAVLAHPMPRGAVHSNTEMPPNPPKLAKPDTSEPAENSAIAMARQLFIG